ncbi:MAG: DUF4346 domain-containing protein [Planctomycetes bacterium]|nr:DUF4346 domain-containing protein [Planctomycetota bacterium]
MTKPISPSAWQEVACQIEKARAAKRCWSCGCLHTSLAAIEKAFPDGELPEDLARTICAVRDRLEAVRYDCLGCSICFPALALNALNAEGADIQDSCPADAVEPRGGWPPLPGNYTVLRFHGPAAVCALHDDGLARSVSKAAGPEVAIVGTLQTENLGIERVITNLLANPNVRFLILCGTDSQQRIGHLPGQSFLALAEAGLDERSRIVGAQGKRPVLRNVPRGAVEHFRRTVEVINRIGVQDAAEVLDTARQCGKRDPGPAEPFPGADRVAVIPGRLPEHMIPDPAGYFVVYVDRRQERLSLEHYRKDGVLDAVIEGRTAAELYTPAIERTFLSRLDHAAYLGRELAKAEAALKEDSDYVQDGAPERAESPEAKSACGCGPACGEKS